MPNYSNPVLEGIAWGDRLRQAAESSRQQKIQFANEQADRQRRQEHESASLLLQLLGVGARQPTPEDRAALDSGPLEIDGGVESAAPPNPLRARIRSVAGNDWIFPTAEESHARGLAQKLDEAAKVADVKGAKEIEQKKKEREALGYRLKPEFEKTSPLEGGQLVPEDALRSLFGYAGTLDRTDERRTRPVPTRDPKTFLGGDSISPFLTWRNAQTGAVEAQRVPGVGPRPAAPRAPSTAATPQERAAVLSDRKRAEIDKVIKELATQKGKLEGEIEDPLIISNISGRHCISSENKLYLTYQLKYYIS